MLTRTKANWQLKESAVTPENLFLNRRSLLAGMAAAATVGTLLPQTSRAATYPVPKNPAYQPDIAITPEDLATTYTNYYEFGSSKNIWRKAQKLTISPWEVEITGEVDNPMTVDFSEIENSMPLEERIYRHRCVEAWSMVVPYSGFELSHLVKQVQPNANAKYVVFETFVNRKEATGQSASWYPWPYLDGITIEEAMHPLTFMATGLYGKPLPKQNGAPWRLALPWKYGFKHVKGLKRIVFTSERPVGFWEQLQAREYGFWANVNPEYDHPRWTQATERQLATGERVPTLLYNGYAEEVAGLYAGMPQDRTLFY